MIFPEFKELTITGRNPYCVVDMKQVYKDHTDPELYSFIWWRWLDRVTRLE
jgi:hypothetical protein